MQYIDIPLNAHCTGTFWKKVVVFGSGLMEDGICAGDLIDLVNAEYARQVPAGWGDTASCNRSTPQPSPDCKTAVFEICCSAGAVEAKGTIEDSVLGSVTVTGVTHGQEKAAAEAAFEQFANDTPYPDHSADGYTRTDGIRGYVYTVGMGENEGTSTVIVDCFKKAGYGKAGMVSTLEMIGSGGGPGSGLTSEQTAAAVSSGVGSALDDKSLTGAGVQGAFEAALNTKGLTGEGVKDQLDAAFDRAHQLGYMDGSSSGPLNMDWSNFPGIKPSDLGGTYTGGDGSGKEPFNMTADQKTGISTMFSDAVSGPMSTFIENMKGTGLMSGVSGFLSPDNVTGNASAPAPVTFNTTYFGTWDFSYTSFMTPLLILKAVILISFGYASVKIVMRGGSG